MSWNIPGYAAEEMVGFGAVGEVWRGRALASGETVALKRLRVPDPVASARLRREAALLAALDHPHLLRLRDTVCVGEEWILVLEYAAGGSLAALLRHRGRLRPGEVVTVLSPLAAALAYAHGEGLVHGDVAPTNVLFRPDGRPLLADLGVARAAGDTEPVRVTPDYADPVVAAGAPPGPASDVFALAAVGFHALTGLPPWNAATAEDTLFVAAGGEVPDLRELAPGTPAALLEVLERALSTDPSARGGAAEFALDLRHACPPEPIALPDRTDTTIPDAARPAALTHDTGRPRPAGPPPGSAHGRHHRPDRRRSGPAGSDRRRLGPVGRLVGSVAASPGLRAVVLAVIGLAVAVRLGIAWAGAGPGAPDRAAGGGSGPVAGGPPAAEGRVAGPPASTGPVVPTASPSPATRWTGVLTRLDSRRQAAYADADDTLLSGVYTPGSAALTGDLRQLRAVTARRMVARGVRHRVQTLRVLRADAAGAVLDVRESLAGYQIRSGSVVVRTEPAGPTQRYRVSLMATDDGWRISAIQQLWS